MSQAALLGWYPETCLNDYSGNIDVYFHYSGAFLFADPYEEEKVVADRFSLADAQAHGCWSYGGRYWEINIDRDRYLATLFAFNPELGLIMDRVGTFPKVIIEGLCAPSSCNDTHIRTRVLPMFLSKVILVEDMIAPNPSEFVARELTHWSTISLDFVVVGVDRCGTHSLRKALLRNPDILLTSTEEDLSNFFSKSCCNVLPYKVEVDKLNNIWPAYGHNQRTIHGLVHPDLYRFARTRQALARIPSLRVIAIVCDPLSRVEKVFWNEVLGSPPPQSGSESRRRERYPLSEDTLANLDFQRKWWHVGDNLKSVARLFGKRFWLTHQAMLRYHSLETYNDLAAFLGAALFAHGTEFQRYNSKRGHRTSLCHNASLVAALQGCLASEYLALEELLDLVGSEVPDELKFKWTRCDRPEELIVPPRTTFTM